MKTTIKILKEIRFHLIYVFYFLLTLEARNRYEYGIMRGHHVVKWERDLTGVDVTMERGKKPEREYSTYKELRVSHKELGKL